MEGTPARRRQYLQWCWVPPAVWAGVLWYLPRSGDADGLGVLLALLVPGLLSAAGLILGVWLVVIMARKTGQIDVLILFATLLSSSPALSYLLRNIAR